MKIKIAIVALVIVGMFSCTQRTCPTYTKEIKDVPQEEQVSVEKDKRV